MADTVTILARDVEQALGARLVALLVYGSAARDDVLRERGARVNTLLICDRIDEALFAALEGTFASWTKAGNEPPLIFSEDEWRTSSDVFAIEYEEMRAAHRLVAGRDPWPGITVQREDVRRQLEAELRGKLVRLRQAWAALRNDGKRLTQVITASVPGVLTMFRTLLRLSGRPVPPGAEQVVVDAAALVGFPGSALDDVADHSAGRKRLTLAPRDARAAAYLDAVARTAAFVDRLP